MYRVRRWSVRHARLLEWLYDRLERLFVRLHPLARAIGYEQLERPVALIERCVKGWLFDCKMCGQCALSSAGMSCPMNCPKALRNGPCGGVRSDGSCEIIAQMRCVWVEAWEGSRRMRRGDAIQVSPVRNRSPSPRPILLAGGGAPQGRGARTASHRGRSRAMIFEDEPVPGYPLPILPGHVSPGRFERVLRAGAFAVTTELAPPDSADPQDVYRRARVFDGYVDAINATDGCGANCHMSSLAVCALVDPRGLRPGDADLLPRQKPHRHPGRHFGRRRHGRVQHPLSDRRRSPGRRPSAGQAGVRPRFGLAAGHRHGDARRAPFRERPQDQLRAAGVLWRRRESVCAAACRGARTVWPRRSPPARSSSRPSTAFDIDALKLFLRRVEDLGVLDRIFVLPGVGTLPSAKTAEWMRRNVPGVHIPDAVVRAWPARRTRQEGATIAVELIQQMRRIKGIAGVHIMAYRMEEFVAGDRRALGRSGVATSLVSRTGPTSFREKGERMTDTVISSATREVVIGFERPFVLIGERINPTGRKMLAAEMAAGRLHARRGRRAGAGGGRRAHARRQRRHPAGRRTGHPGQDHRARAVPGRRAAVHRLVDRRCAGGRACRLPGQGAGQLGHGRGRAPRGRAASGKKVRRRGGGNLQRRDRHIARSGRALRGGQEDRAARRRPRHPRLRHRRRSAGDAHRCDQPAPACKSCGCSTACAPNSRSTPPAAPPTSASGCPNAKGSTPPSCTMAIASGMTSAITNPMHAELVRAIMAADVHHGPRPKTARAGSPLPRRSGPRSRGRRPRPPRRQPPAPAGRSAVRELNAVRIPMPRSGPTHAAVTPMAAPGRLHALGQAGPFPQWHAAAAGGAQRWAWTSTRSAAGARCAAAARCVVAEGEFAKHGVPPRPQSLSTPVSEPEQRFAGRAGLAPGRRLSCSARVDGDVVIDVPADQPGAPPGGAQGCRSARRSSCIRWCACTTWRCASPTCTIRRATCAGCDDALELEWQLDRPRLRPAGCRQLQPALRQGDWKVTVAVHDASQIIAVWPGLHERAYGLAVDIGSTTIAAHLCDLAQRRGRGRPRA